MELEESKLDEIIQELRSTNQSQDAMLDSVNDLNTKALSNSIDSIDSEISTSISSIADYVSRLFSFMTGNKLLEEENRREMIDALDDIGENTSNDVQSKGNGSKSSGMFDGIGKMFSSISGMISSYLPTGISTMLSPVITFFTTFLKFGKSLIRFAGPIGIAIAVITGLVGGIMGAIKGYKESGVEGAIKGGLTGIIDALIGSLARIVADAAGWLLEAIGFKRFGAMLGPYIDGFFKNFYKGIGGIVDVVIGIFTLDSDKVIGGLKNMFSAFVDNFASLFKLLFNLILDIGPLLYKTFKFFWFQLPAFLGKMLWKLITSLPSMIEKLAEFTGEMTQKLITEFLPFIGEKLSEFVTMIKDDLSQMISGVWDGISTAIADAMNSIGKFLGVEDMMTWLSSAFLGAQDALKQKIQEILDKILEFVNKFNPFYEKENIQDQQKKIAEKEGKSWGEIEKEKNKAWSDYKQTDQYKNTSPEIRQALDKKFLESLKNPQATINSAQINSIPSNKGQVLNDASKTANTAPIIINQMGGNVTNTSVSSVNNNTSSIDPIMTGSSMALSMM